jgi:hypothetical protein
VKLLFPIPKLTPGASRVRLPGSRFTFHVSRPTPRARRSTLHAPRSTSPAFTLVEILVTVALLSFIILGLFAMFNQVQRAFRSSMTQVDQLEAGRAVTELLPREIEQMIPSGYLYPTGVNFYVRMPNSTPLTQWLPGSTPILRTNLLEDCFMLLRQNQIWTGIGYCVRTNDANGRLWLPECGPGQMGVGSLYRFVVSTNVIQYNGLPSNPAQLATAFANACLPGSAAISNRICDGIIHFHFRSFATNGFPIFGEIGLTNAFYRPDALSNFLRPSTVRPALAIPALGYPDNLRGLYFYSNALPAAVQMEFGILEQQAWDRYNSIGTPAARLNYLQSTNYYLSSRVHLFRQRIPIRNVDPLAYQ